MSRQLDPLVRSLENKIVRDGGGASNLAVTGMQTTFKARRLKVF